VVPTTFLLWRRRLGHFATIVVFMLQPSLASTGSQSSFVWEALSHHWPCTLFQTTFMIIERRVAVNHRQHSFALICSPLPLLHDNTAVVSLFLCAFFLAHRLPQCWYEDQGRQTRRGPIISRVNYVACNMHSWRLHSWHLSHVCIVSLFEL
jgi:hypothetical protein